MKKLSFFTLALVGFMLMTGCKRETVDPTLTIVTGEGYLSEGMEIMVGEPFMVGLKCEADKIAALNIIFMKGETIMTECTKTWDDASTATYEDTFVIMEDGDITMTAKLIDTNGKAAIVTLNFKSIPIPLPDPDPDPQPTFEGHYQGTVNMTATASALGVSYPFEAPFPLEISFTEAEEEYQVNATVSYEDKVYTTTGTFTNGTIILEPFDIEFDVLGSIAKVTLGMSCAIGEATLAVQGTFAGNGNIVLPDMQGFAIPATIEGSLEGNLNEVE